MTKFDHVGVDTMYHCAKCGHHHCIKCGGCHRCGCQTYVKSRVERGRVRVRGRV